MADGFGGLGVYDKGKEGVSFDKMFAVIFLISVISLLLICRQWNCPEEMHAMGQRAKMTIGAIDRMPGRSRRNR